MNKIIKLLCLPIDYFFIGLVYFYKVCISPFFNKTCRFFPTCSTYMINCIKRFSFAKGIFLGLKRLSRCRGKNAGGFDPVPPNLKGEQKWLY